MVTVPAGDTAEAGEGITASLAAAGAAIEAVEDIGAVAVVIAAADIMPADSVAAAVEAVTVVVADK
jgi:hypothetical protein